MRGAAEEKRLTQSRRAAERSFLISVMAALVAAIHFPEAHHLSSWMAGTSPAMTTSGVEPELRGSASLRELFYAVFATVSPNSCIIASRIRNFCTLPVTVIGNDSTKRM